MRMKMKSNSFKLFWRRRGDGGYHTARVQEELKRPVNTLAGEVCRSIENPSAIL